MFILIYLSQCFSQIRLWFVMIVIFAACFFKMQNIPILKARVAYNKFDIIISGFLNSSIKTIGLVLINVNYTKHHVIAITHRTVYCIILSLLGIINDTFWVTATFFAAYFNIHRLKFKLSCQFLEIIWR